MSILKTIFVLAAPTLLAAFAAGKAEKPLAIDRIAAPPGLTLASPAMKAGAAIPEAFAGAGGNASPPLTWSGAPKATRSFAIVVEDPDAPMPRPFVHWVIWNIPAGTAALAQGASKPNGAVEGLNDFGKRGYFGPRPPAGQRHHYVFQLFALDRALDVAAGSDLVRLEAAMKGHVLASGRFTATYARR